MAGRLFSLLVGIDSYVSPVPALQGCVNDVERFADLLPHLVGDDVLVDNLILVNQEASRAGLIAAFRGHLGQAGPEDTALFYFSGHGAFEVAPPEFWSVEPDHMNETLVCHDSRNSGSWDLADKELAQLISEVGARGPQFLAVLDCCHSGSGTRALMEDGIVVRAAPRDIRTRELADYLSDQRPVSPRHVLVAACRSDQTAKEVVVDGEHRGAFSAALESALTMSAGRIAYRDLVAWTTAHVAKTVLEQTPQLECYGTRPDQLFLDGVAASGKGYWVMTHAAGQWWVNAGSLTGLYDPADDESTVFAIFPRDADKEVRRDLKKSLGFATVRFVEAGRSAVDVELARDAALEPVEMYLCVLLSLPLPPIPVQPPDHPDDEGRVRMRLEESAYLKTAVGERKAELQVTADAGGYRIRDIQTGPIKVAGTSGVSDEDADTVVRQLEHIARWRRLRDLENPGARISASDLELNFFDANHHQLDLGHGIRMVYGSDGAQPTITISIRNRSSRDLYVALYALSEEFEVTALIDGQGSQRIAPGEELWAFSGKPIHLSVPRGRWERDVTVSTDLVKALVSTAAFDAARLTEEALSEDELPRVATRHVAAPHNTLDRLIGRIPTRAMSRLPEDEREIVDWLALSVQVTVERPLAATTLTGGSVDIGGGVTLDVPDGVNGRVKLSMESSASRDLTMHAIPRVLQDESVAFAVRPDRGTSGLSVVELRNVENAELVTPKNPVELTVPATLRADETVLAVAFDGEFWLPVGHVRAGSAEATTIVIDRLPTEITPDRGLGKAIRILLRKLVSTRLGLTEDYPRLAVATVDQAGTVQYDADPDHVRRALAAARRVLLCVHGITGDTVGMIRGTAEFHALYDLVLAFDYESIATPIEENARLLHERLTAAEIKPHHRLDVLAHSMGGLVARTMIELRGAATIVSHLVTAGTPNGGSPWPKVQDWATAALGAGLNAMAAMFWPAGMLGGLVHLLERVDTGLDDLSPSSPLLKQLYGAADPKRHYTALMGDRSLAPNAGGLLAALGLKWFTEGALTIAFRNQPNDIAVAVMSGQHFPAGRQPAPNIRVIACDHLTYFSSSAGRQAIREALERP